MRILKESGVIASEMEAAMLFVLASLKNAILKVSENLDSVIAGCSTIIGKIALKDVERNQTFKTVNFKEYSNSN